MDPLALLDRSVFHAIYGGADGRWGLAMTCLTWMGAGWSALLLLPLLAHVPTRAFASRLTLAVAAQCVLVWGLKALFGRVRPWVALGLATPPGAPSDPSFPSGHAAGAFCLAAFLVVVLPSAWPSRPRLARAVGAGVLVYAALVASSRVYLGAHWPGDVLAGALLGAAVGALVARAHVRRDGVEREAKKS